MVRSIKTWFRRKARIVALPSAPSSAPDWSAAHATDLRKFLSSETGQVLMQRAHSLECATALKACHDQESVNPARAAGFSDALRWLESLSISVSPETQSDTTEEAVAWLNSNYALTEARTGTT